MTSKPDRLSISAFWQRAITWKTALVARARQDLQFRYAWERRGIGWLESTTGLAFIVAAPIVARFIDGQFRQVLGSSGFGRLLDILQGDVPISDISNNVAASWGLISRDFRAYDPLNSLHPNIGVNIAIEHAHTHPPLTFILTIPFAQMDVSSWLPFFVSAMGVALAWSLRLMSVRPSFAYPITAVVVATVPGQESLLTTYPLTALCVAWVWRQRFSGYQVAVPLTLIAAMRAVTALPGLVFLLAGRIKVVLLVVAASLLLALANWLIEPSVFSDWLTLGRSAIDFTVGRGDNLALPNLSRTLGVSPILILTSCLVIAILAFVRGCSLFWILYWLALASSPIAWSYTVVLLLPVLAYLWRESRMGPAISITCLAVTTANLSTWGVNWQISLLLVGAGLLTTSTFGSSHVSSSPSTTAGTPATQ